MRSVYGIKYKMLAESATVDNSLEHSCISHIWTLPQSVTYRYTHCGKSGSFMHLVGCAVVFFLFLGFHFSPVTAVRFRPAKHKIMSGVIFQSTDCYSPLFKTLLLGQIRVVSWSYAHFFSLICSLVCFGHYNVALKWFSLQLPSVSVFCGTASMNLWKMTCSVKNVYF